MQQLNKLTRKQATVVAQLHEPPRDEPTLRAERNLMVNFTMTQPHAKGVAPSANREGGGGADRGRCGQSLKCLTSTHRRQLVKIHTITAAQLVECAREHRLDPIFSLVRAGTGW
jgi:hypothetical protein